MKLACLLLVAASVGFWLDEALRYAERHALNARPIERLTP